MGEVPLYDPRRARRIPRQAIAVPRRAYPSLGPEVGPTNPEAGYRGAEAGLSSFWSRGGRLFFCGEAGYCWAQVKGGRGMPPPNSRSCETTISVCFTSHSARLQS